MPFLPDNYYQMTLAQQQAWWATNSPGTTAFLSGSTAATAPAATTTGGTAAAGGSSQALNTALSGGGQAFSAYTQVKGQTTQSKLLAGQNAAQQQQALSQNLNTQVSTTEHDLSVLSDSQQNLATAQSKLSLAQQTFDGQTAIAQAQYNANVAAANNALATAQAKATQAYEIARGKSLDGTLSGGQDDGAVLGQIHDAIPTTSDPSYQAMLANAELQRQQALLVANNNLGLAKIDVETQQANVQKNYTAVDKDYQNLPDSEAVKDPGLSGRISTIEDKFEPMQPPVQPGINATSSPTSPAPAPLSSPNKLISEDTGSLPYGQSTPLMDANGEPILFASTGNSLPLPSASYAAGGSSSNFSVASKPAFGSQMEEDASSISSEGGQDAFDATYGIVAPVSPSVEPVLPAPSGSLPVTPSGNSVISSLPAHAGDLEGLGGLATEFGAGFGLVKSVISGSWTGALASFGGLYAGMKMISGALSSSLAANNTLPMAGSFGSFFDKIPGLSQAYNWIMLHPLFSAMIVAAVIVAITLLMNRQNAAEKQIANFDGESVWSTGQVLTLTSAAAFLALGYNINTPSTSLTGGGLSIPVATLKGALASGLSNADGSAYTGAIPYNVPIVLKGQAPGGGDQVIEITQNGIKNGQAADAINTYNLSNNMTFNKPTATAGTAGQVGGYVPFFVNGQVNPVAVTARNSQTTLLAATPALSAPSQTGAVAVAGAMDKTNIGVNNSGN